MYEYSQHNEFIVICTLNHTVHVHKFKNIGHSGINNYLRIVQVLMHNCAKYEMYILA